MCLDVFMISPLVARPHCLRQLKAIRPVIHSGFYRTFAPRLNGATSYQLQREPVDATDHGELQGKLGLIGSRDFEIDL
jgi:hypothetical protein